MKNPKIRFKGCTEDWEQRKLGEVFEQTTNFVNLDEGKMELWSLTVEDGLTPKSERYNREFLVKKDTNFKEVRPGDIVYNPMNMTLGAVGYNGMAKSVAVSGYYTTMVANAGYDSYYINTWLKSPYAISLYKTFATGSLKEKQRVQFPTLSIIPTVFPESEEQKKIGLFFERLDTLITLHQRKCEEAKKLKKYMLQKMFPKDGAKVPEIRFAGFTDDWEQRKFGKLAVRESDCDMSSVDKPCVEYEDVIANEGQLNKDITLKEVQKKGIIFDGSQVLYGKLRPYLHNWLNPDFMGIAVGDWWVLRPVELDKSFLYRLIQTQQFNDVANQSAGSKMPRADWNLIAETEFMVPRIIEEQVKIGEYLTNLDTLITLHQRKCDELQNIKKYMLQNMFV
ncbi:MAG: restriction endonuclease subunit S [Lachnospiraceae bacterium]|nr:restriction endonuclease subunit S [Lachnospiraceae bacterium]